MRVDDVTCRASYSTRPGLRVCRRCDRNGRTIHMSANICRRYVKKERERPHHQNTKPRSHVSSTRKSLNPQLSTGLAVSWVFARLYTPSKIKIKPYATITSTEKPLTNNRLTRVRPSARARDRHKSKTPIRGAHRARRKCESTFITLSFFAR